jgi:hypothetical protein
MAKRDLPDYAEDEPGAELPEYAEDLPSYAEDLPSETVPVNTAEHPGQAPVEPEPDDGMTSSVPGAFGRGALKGVTANFDDELGGKVQSKLADVANVVHGVRGNKVGDLLANGFDTVTGIDTRYPGDDSNKVYEDARNAIRAQHEADEKQHGFASGAGQFAGKLARDIPLAIASGGLTATPMGQGVEGLVEGLGGSNSDNPAMMALDALIGGAEGAAFTKAGNVVGKGVAKVAKPVLEKIAPKVDDVAKYLAAKALGGGKADYARFAAKNSGVLPLGDAALDSGVVKWPGLKSALNPRAPITESPSLQGIALRAEAISDQAGQKVGKILEGLDSVAGRPVVDSNALGQAIVEQVLPTIPKTSQNELYNKVGKFALRYIKRGPMTLAEANLEKNGLDNAIKSWGDVGTSMDQRTLKALRKVMSDQVDAGVKNVEASSPRLKGIFNSWLDAKKNYGLTETMDKMARPAAAEQKGLLFQNPLKSSKEFVQSGLGSMGAGKLRSVAQKMAALNPEQWGREFGILSSSAHPEVEHFLLSQMNPAWAKAFEQAKKEETDAANQSTSAR